MTAAPRGNVRSMFTSGVASGDPLPDRVVLWTRCVPPSLGPVALTWVVARDPDLRHVVARGEALALPERDHTVHVDADGLDPATTYFFAFDDGEERSPVGRTRTTPEGAVEHLRIAVFSCAKFTAGYFNALARMADLDDLDLVLCLGDYIYEYGNADKGLGTRIGRPFEPAHRCRTLEDYRRRYAQSRRDPDMQRMHLRHPVVAIPDDHEFADNAWRGGAKKHVPPADGRWDRRRADAFRAWREWMPVRMPDSEDATRLFRTMHLGELADLILLDTRTRRDHQASGAEVEREDRTLLGAEQFEWFTGELTQSRAAWRLIGNGVMIGQVRTDYMPEDVGEPLSELGVLTPRDQGPEPDQWDGYPAERRRLIHDITDHDVRDVVFLSGDVHSSWACDLKLGSHDPEERSVAVEFCTTSATSENLDEEAGWEPRTRSVPIEREIVEDNPHIAFCELDSHGFLLVDVTPERVQADWQYVDTVRRPSRSIRCGGSWMVRRGQHRLEEAPGPLRARSGEEPRRRAS
ncbi:MAG: alkaline phosphatase D family protein [Actinomycetota bacterium]